MPDLSALLAASSIRLDESAASRDDAVRIVGGLLVDAGAVTSSYVEAMLEREHSVSTLVGEGIAFPHATSAAAVSVHRDAIAVALFPAGVDWAGHTAHAAIGIAAVGGGHIRLLSRLARVLLVPGTAEALRSATSEASVRALLDG